MLWGVYNLVETGQKEAAATGWQRSLAIHIEARTVFVKAKEAWLSVYGTRALGDLSCSSQREQDSQRVCWGRGTALSSTWCAVV